MSFSTIEAINTVNEFKQKAGTRLIYVNDPINMDTADQGKQFIEGILAKTSGSEIKFQDYNEMIKYMNSIDYLKRIIKMPDVNASKGKCFKYINKLRKDDALQKIVTKLKLAYDAKPVWTLGSLSDDYNAWLSEEKQIVVPDNYKIQANQIISKYMKFVSSLPKEKQAEVQAFLYNLQFAETLFKTERELNNKIIFTLIKKLELKTKKLGSNIFFSVIDIEGDEYQAITNMYYWLSRPINSMFTINDQMVGDGIQQILSGELQKQKDKNKQEKLEQEAQDKKDKEKKEEEKKKASEKASAEPIEFEDVASEAEDTVELGENVSRIQAEIPNLGTPATIEANLDFTRNIQNAEDSFNHLSGTVNNVINQKY